MSQTCRGTLSYACLRSRFLHSWCPWCPTSMPVLIQLLGFSPSLHSSPRYQFSVRECLLCTALCPSHSASVPCCYHMGLLHCGPGIPFFPGPPCDHLPSAVITAHSSVPGVHSACFECLVHGSASPWCLLLSPCVSEAIQLCRTVLCSFSLWMCPLAEFDAVCVAFLCGQASGLGPLLLLS